MSVRSGPIANRFSCSHTPFFAPHFSVGGINFRSSYDNELSCHLSSNLIILQCLISVSQFCFGFEKSEEKERACFAAKHLPLLTSHFRTGVWRAQRYRSWSWQTFASIFGGNSKHWIVSGSGLSVHTNNRIDIF